jgi:hypothetical protein
VRFRLAHVAGTHDVEPHAPATPPPPHVSPAGHEQVISPPHPSPFVPQPTPAVEHVMGVQPPQTPETPPPPHVCPDAQGPQSSAPPQPSPAGPHWMFCAAHVVGTHEPEPQTPGVPPPPQVSVPVHGLQYAVRPPHPSACWPQTPGNALHVSGVHAPESGAPHTLATPPPPHVAGRVHVVQLARSPPHPLDCCPHVPAG